jgi:hypothetical protein
MARDRHPCTRGMTKAPSQSHVVRRSLSTARWTSYTITMHQKLRNYEPFTTGSWWHSLVSGEEHPHQPNVDGPSIAPPNSGPDHIPNLRANTRCIRPGSFFDLFQEWMRAPAISNHSCPITIDVPPPFPQQNELDATGLSPLLTYYRR